MVFELELSSEDSSKIDLGTTIVSTGSNGATVSFRCEYALDITLTSDSFTLEEVTVSGVQSAVGKLDAGFSLVLGDGTGQPVNLGEMLDVTISWEIEPDYVSFYIEDCRVEQGATVVEIIKERCYSESLKVTPMYEAPYEHWFKMMTFTMDNESTNEQFIVCEIKICTDNCDKPTDNSQCPVSLHYKYSVNGY